MHLIGKKYHLARAGQSEGQLCAGWQHYCFALAGGLGCGKKTIGPGDSAEDLEFIAILPQTSLADHYTGKVSITVRLPREVWPIWPASWFGPDGKPLYHRPVLLLLKKPLRPSRGWFHWQEHLERQRLKMGGQKVPEFPSTFTFPGYGGLALVTHDLRG